MKWGQMEAPFLPLEKTTLKKSSLIRVKSKSLNFEIFFTEPQIIL